jgi:hypothetical protein
MLKIITLKIKFCKMKKLTYVFLFLVFCSMNIYAQNEDEMKKWMAYMTPGKEHEMLAKMVGNWNVATTMWMAPGAPPEKSDGTMVCEMIYGGRYQQAKFNGTAMGMPFEGTSLTAFDNGKKVFINIWMDNMGTGVMYCEGKYDEKTKNIVFEGTMFDPLKGKDIKFKEIMIQKDDNNYVMEMYANDDAGKEFKTLEIIYNRK